MKLKRYEQTTIYTCGACCILTAYHELYGLELSKRNEMLIWEYIKNPIKWIGSLPGKMIKFLSVIDQNSILYLPQKYPFRQIHFLIRWAYILLVNGHNQFTIRKLEKQNFNIVRFQDEVNLETLAKKLIQNEKLRVIFAFIKEKLELHYVLMRAKDNMIVVMDSREEDNHFFEIDEFLKKYNPIDFRVYIQFGKDK